MIIETICIAVFFVVVIDQLRFTDDITSIISGWLTNGQIKKPFQLKPFTCSTCLTWWTSLIYLLCTHRLTIPSTMYIVVLAWSTPIINDILTLLKQTVLKILNKLL